MKPKDFSRVQHFPGTTTSRFDGLVRVIAAIEKIPAPIFAALLFALALAPTRAELSLALGLWLFFLGDWILLALLPRAEKSFGPAKPPTFELAAMRALFAVLPLPFSALAQIVGTALVVYAFWIEPHRVHVTRETLQTAKLKSLARPLRVLHLGDLHVERITARERALVAHARDLQPDVILFSGDFLNLSNIHDPTAWEHARAILRDLRAPLGVFAVTGSPPVDQPEVVARLLDGSHIRWLRDEKVSLDFDGQPVDLVGITCTHKPHVDRVTLDAILHGDPDPFTILLYHTPDLAPEAALQQVDLQLSGHTHGGQVRVPFFGALYAASLYGKLFEMGRHQIGALTLYVTRGIGLEGEGAPRVRFLCPPEIILWEISGEGREGKEG
ncbi:MAG: metallophosphoesterase [Chloroflexi bacterium]|nr:metallophosphoesterase [Chloroflexota bacterium]